MLEYMYRVRTCRAASTLGCASVVRVFTVLLASRRGAGHGPPPAALTPTPKRSAPLPTCSMPTSSSSASRSCSQLQDCGPRTSRQQELSRSLLRRGVARRSPSRQRRGGPVARLESARGTAAEDGRAPLLAAAALCVDVDHFGAQPLQKGGERAGLALHHEHHATHPPPRIAVQKQARTHELRRPALQGAHVGRSVVHVVDHDHDLLPHRAISDNLARGRLLGGESACRRSSAELNHGKISTKSRRNLGACRNELEEGLHEAGAALLSCSGEGGGGVHDRSARRPLESPLSWPECV